MALFNYTVKYSVEVSKEEVDGAAIELRKAIIEFDDFWGRRRTYTILAPADLWTGVKVGGTASTGDNPSVGVVTKVKSGSIFRTVWIPDLDSYVTCYCLPVDDDFQIGDTGLVVEHMRHEPEQYGKFDLCIMRDIPAGLSPNLHSINLIVFKNNEQIGMIHLDPYIVYPGNYDDMDVGVRDRFIG